jgi:hypothetical protein
MAHEGWIADSAHAGGGSRDYKLWVPAALDHTAVVFEDCRLNFREFNPRVNCLAKRCRTSRTRSAPCSGPSCSHSAL